MSFLSRALFTVCVVSLASNPTLLLSQKYKVVKKLPPAAVVDHSFAILDAVVTEQWPATLPLVNAPTDMELLNPGQCIRAAALAGGEGHEHYFDHANLSWTVRMAGKDVDFPSSPANLIKQIKLEGADRVLAALQAGAIKGPIPSMAEGTMAASGDKWCVPRGASDQKVEVRVTVTSGDEQTVLKAQTIQIESLASAAKKTFKDDREFGNFVQTYHVSPEPGRLLPAFEYLVAMDNRPLNCFMFFKAVFRHDAATVQGFGPGLTGTPKRTQMRALNLLAKAGVTLLEPPALTDEEKKSIAEAPDLPDGYDMKPTPELFTKLDFLWADFSATGRLQPINAIVSALAWRSDYDAFDAMRKAGKTPKPDELTESLCRGLAYSAAGWALGSFQRSDPLAADYIEAISANPSTSAAIKDELAHLGTNPAFKQQ
jgi:hypothetical protein